MKIYFDKKSFTIIEMTIVISIVSILSLIVLINYSTSQNELALQRSINKLAQDVRRVQAMAMAADDFKSKEDFLWNSPTPSQGGFGIKISTNDTFYILFADCDKDKELDGDFSAQSCFLSGETGMPYPEELENVALEKNVKIGGILLDNSHVDSVVITFVPPSPEANFNPDGQEVIISLTSGKRSANVKINRAGVITIEFPTPTPITPTPTLTPTPTPTPSQNLNCSIGTSCSGTTVFKISNSTNAHAELPSQNNYTYYVCCTGITGLGNDCNAANKIVVLKLSDITNAHVEENSYSNYPNNVCLSAPTGKTIICNYNSSCSTGYSCLASISAETNAHVGDCNVYSIKICCKIE